jgi:hypothetical protein
MNSKHTYFFKSLLAFVFFLLTAPPSVFSQKITISGYVEDAASSEKLISAAVFDKKSASGVVSNTYGFYSLTLPKGNIDLVISYVGYKPQTMSLDLRRDTTIVFKLSSDVELEAVEISAKKQDRIENRTQMSQITVPIQQIKKIPALLGEVDVLKALQLLPGVQGGTEGTNGIYVRGGSPDQNLILLDGVPVYNVSHIGGFFSVFNGDAIRNVTLTKGGFPARFGGRLSSILEIDMKEGNMKKFHGEAGIGLISSRLTLEGPIVKDKASFMISGRRTYLDLILNPIAKAAVGSEAGTVIAHFYDLNAKVNWKINEKHRLYLSAYNGQDKFGFLEKYTSGNDRTRLEANINWGNITTALRWNWLISNKLFANTTVTYSRFKNGIYALDENRSGTTTSAFLIRYRSGIDDWAGKMEFDYLPTPNHRLRFGGGATYHTYNPGATQLKQTNTNSKFDTTLGSRPSYGFEPYVFIEDEMQLGALKANIGLHASGFAVKDEFYTSLQPRLGLNYPLSKDWSAKASFATMRQFINLLANERIGLPTDLWVPTTQRIKPQDSWQAAVGVAKTFKDEYEFSVEAYYKQMKNVLAYQDGASFLGSNTNWEDKVVQGNGEAYGTEVLLQKKEGRTTGWIGYTLSWNWRQFDKLNSGERFPFRYDRRHDVELVISHKFSDRFSLSGTWQYQTGNAVTLPLINYSAPNNPDIINSLPWGGGNFRNKTEISTERNGFRTPAYHRMDISFELSKKRKRYTRTWVLGVYNLYGRANPTFLFNDSKYDSANNRSIPVVRAFSLLPIPLPSFSYNLKF